MLSMRVFKTEDGCRNSNGSAPDIPGMALKKNGYQENFQMENMSYILSYIVMGMMFLAWALWDKKRHHIMEKATSEMNVRDRSEGTHRN